MIVIWQGEQWEATPFVQRSMLPTGQVLEQDVVRLHALRDNEGGAFPRRATITAEEFEQLERP